MLTRMRRMMMWTMMDRAVNRPGNKVTTVTKEHSNAMDERPHYVRMKESDALSRGHFTDNLI